LRPCEGGLGLGNSAATAAAAYVAATVDCAALVADLCPDLRPLLDTTALTDPAFLTGLHPIDYLTGIADAVQRLPDASRAVLAGLFSTDAADAPAAAADAAAAPPRPPRSFRSLQQQLSRPIHQDAQRRLREEQLAGRAADAAQHLSECGWLGTAWLEALPRGDTEMSAQTYRTAMSIFLHLPYAAFEGRTCLCGARVTSATGIEHVDLCPKFYKTTPHNIIGEAYDSILRSLPGQVAIVGEGGQAPALGTVWQPRLVGGVQQLVEATVYPDRYVTGIRSDPPAMRRVLDFTGVNVRAKRYCERGRAATEPLFAARVGHEDKKKHYGRPGLLAAGDVLQPVAVELHGGIHPEARQQLQEWARVAAGVRDPDQGRGILRVWRMTLALGLLRARVARVMGAVVKLGERDRRSVPVAEGQLCVPARRRGIDGVCRQRSELEREIGFLPRAGRFGRGRRR
jgi:hypothetical protein